MPRFGEQPFGGGGARLQRVEPHVETGAFGLMLFLGLVERGAEAAAFGVGLGKAWPRPCRAGARVAVNVFSLSVRRRVRRAVSLSAGIDRQLQRVLLVVEQRQLLAGGGEFAFEFADALLGGVELILQGALVFDQAAALRAFVRQLALEFDDLGVAGGNVVGQCRVACFPGARLDLRDSSRSSRSLSDLGFQRVALRSIW